MNLFGKTLSQLQAICLEHNLPKYTAAQICDWMYHKRVTDISAMTNLSIKTRTLLSQHYSLSCTPPLQTHRSVDGTKKYLFTVDETPGRFVETVYIPTEDRATLCISCQVGCRMGCRFCVTGSQGWHGNLSTHDILNQIFSIPESSTLTNIVFMGMGEPMDNIQPILDVIEIMTAKWGLGWSPHRITVSSVGIIPGLQQLLDNTDCHIAISLHNAFSQERLAIMPMEKAYPIKKVIDLLKRYNWHGQRRISFEYTMMKGINDDLNHAAEIIQLVKGLPCRINLIRFHASPGIAYQPSSEAVREKFRDYLVDHGITCTLRASRGEDIMAACGLLAGKASEN